MTLELYGDWKKAKKTLMNMQRSLDRIIVQFLHLETETLRSYILEVFSTQGSKAGWAPLSPWTLAMRRFKGFQGTSILQRSGQLRNSIVSKVKPGDLTGFVGVLYQSKHKGGQRMVNIAQVHEYGSKPIARKMTPKQRRFLALVGARSGLIKGDSPRRGGGGAVTMISIPPRPFMQPGAKEWRKGFMFRATRFFKKAFRSM